MWSLLPHPTPQKILRICANLTTHRGRGRVDTCPPVATPVKTWSTSDKSRLHSTESADSTSKTDDRLNRSTQLSPTFSTQLDSNVKRSIRSTDSIDFGVYLKLSTKSVNGVLTIVYVCSWTTADVNVACQQLGFRKGNFSFLPYARNESSYMLYLEPNCAGDEANILDCPGARNIRIGSKICC